MCICTYIIRAVCVLRSHDHLDISLYADPIYIPFKSHEVCRIQRGFHGFTAPSTVSALCQDATSAGATEGLCREAAT